MERQFGNLEKGPFDVLIIGGGVYGAWDRAGCRSERLEGRRYRQGRLGLWYFHGLNQINPRGAALSGESAS